MTRSDSVLSPALAAPGATRLVSIFSPLNWVRRGWRLLHELVPTASRIAVLANPTDQVRTASNIRDVEAAARAIGLQIHVFSASTTDEVDVAFAAILRERMHALLLSPMRTSILAACNLLPWLRAMRFPRHIRCATTSKRAG